MLVDKQKELLKKYEFGDGKAFNCLVDHYYNSIGLEFINLYPEKNNKERVAKELIVESINRYLEIEDAQTPLTHYIRMQFNRKYKDYEIGFEIDGHKNKKNKIKKSVRLALKNKKDFEKIYTKYYYIIEKYYNMYPDKENKEVCAKALLKKILERILKDDTHYVGTYIKNYFAKNYEKYNPGDELKELTPKTKVSDLIELAQEDQEARKLLMEKYMYIVDDQLVGMEEIEKEEIKAAGYLKLVELINNYFESKIEYTLSVYLITQIKHFIGSYQKQEEKRKNNIAKYEIVENYTEDIANDIVNNMYLMEMLKNADLKERQEIILKYAIGYGVEYRELGQNYGVTKSRAQQIAQSGLERIRKKNNIY